MQGYPLNVCATADPTNKSEDVATRIARSIGSLRVVAVILAGLMVGVATLRVGAAAVRCCIPDSEGDKCQEG